jgi:hypothetical protein
MARRNIHYEAAFEDYLRSRAVPYVPVDETRRVIFAGARVKSFDFLVYPPVGRKWLVDVKGRQFPYVDEKGGSKRYWENWITREDMESMADWEAVFGGDFEARFVFAYLLQGPPDRWPSARPHRFRGEYYAFLSVKLADYQRESRERSERWQTVGVRSEAFRRILQPVDSLLAGVGVAAPPMMPGDLPSGPPNPYNAQSRSIV